MNKIIACVIINDLTKFDFFGSLCLILKYKSYFAKLTNASVIPTSDCC